MARMSRLSRLAASFRATHDLRADIFMPSNAPTGHLVRFLAELFQKVGGLSDCFAFITLGDRRAQLCKSAIMVIEQIQGGENGFVGRRIEPGGDLCPDLRLDLGRKIESHRAGTSASAVYTLTLILASESKAAVTNGISSVVCQDCGRWRQGCDERALCSSSRQRALAGR